MNDSELIKKFADLETDRGTAVIQSDFVAYRDLIKELVENPAYRAIDERLHGSTTQEKFELVRQYVTLFIKM